MVFELAASYIGAIVGAGFASGREHVYFFFPVYLPFRRQLFEIGVKSLLTGFLFALFGAALGVLAFKYQTSSSKDLLKRLVPRPLDSLCDWLMIFFIFGSLSIMLAGSGMLFTRAVGIPKAIGIVITAIVTVLAAIPGTGGLLAINSFMSPFMIFMPIIVAILSVYKGVINSFFSISDFGFVNVSTSRLVYQMIPTLLYVSYNVILAFGVFASLGKDIPDRGTALRGGILGGIGLLIFLIMIQSVLICYGGYIFSDELPMLKAAFTHGLLVGRGYFIALWFAMITTSVCSVFAISQRFNRYFATQRIWLVFGITMVACFPAQFGFGNLIAAIYPIIGYIGLPVLFLVLFHFLK
mgnify:CR=1 FL=1